MAQIQQLWADIPSLQLVRTGRLIRVFAKVTFVVSALAFIAMFFVPWRQTARGVGFVLALDPQERPQPLKSPTSGIVSWVKEDLREGSFVVEGEPLIRLTPKALDGVAAVDNQLAQIALEQVSAENSIINAEQAAVLQLSSGLRLEESLDEEYKVAQQKLRQVENEVDVYIAELRDKRNQLRIAEQGRAGGIVSGQELVTKQQDVEAAFNKFLKAEGAVEEAFAALNSKEKEIQAKKHDINIKNQEAERKVLEWQQKLTSINNKAIDLGVKRAELDRLEIPAPRTGYIQEWNGVEGSDTIKESDQLCVIVPEATGLAVEMRVSGNDMPLLHEGDRVRIQFEGWPAVQFVGWPSVAVGSFGGKVNRVFPTDDGKGFFRVLVVPDKHFEGESEWPDNRYLRQGVRANGWVLLNEVPIGYEIWRQLNGFPPIISDEEPTKSDDKGSKVKLPKM